MVWPEPAAAAWKLRFAHRDFVLEPGAGVLVGRSSACDIVIPGEAPEAERVSRCHLHLRLVAGGVEVTELGSTNGTTVEGAPLGGRGPRRVLEDAALLSLGGCEVLLAPYFLALAPPPPSALAPRYLPRLLGYLGGDQDGVRNLRLPLSLR